MMESMSANSDENKTITSGDSKVLADLATLSEQMDLCHQMMVQQGGPPVDTSNEALLGVIGFLEACAPRMVELVEAGVSQHAPPLFHSEDTLGICLDANDRLNRLLEALVMKTNNANNTTPPGIGIGGSHNDEHADNFFVTSAKAASKPAMDGTVDIDLDDLLLDDDETKQRRKHQHVLQPPKGPLKSDDVFDTGDILQPTPLMEDAKQPASALKSDTTGSDYDEFDAFLNERVSSANIGEAKHP